MKAFGRAAAAAILAGLLGAAWAALLYVWHPTLRLEFDRDLPRNGSGVYPFERDDASGVTFAWTGQEAVLRLPGLDRRVGWTLDLRLRGGRAADDNPDVAVVVDGVTLSTQRATPEWSDLRIAIPARPERRGLTLGLRSSLTFVPGAGDPRALGVMLDRLSLEPEGIVVVPRPALVGTAAAAAAMGAAIALLGVTAGSAIGGAVLLSAGSAAIVVRGFGPFTDYPGTVSTLGLWIGIVLAAAAVAVQYRRPPLRNTARFAAAFSASALFLKLLVLLHPNMPVGDAMFHAHRFQGVLAGNLYFTSIAPGGYAFPYPPGLYVFAAMFAGLVRRGAADMALLRVVTCAADVAAGLLLYWIVARAWRNRLAGAMAVAIYHLIPVNLAVLTTGNLTNAFAQALAVGGLALMAAGRAGTGTFAALALVLAASYLSHTGTLAIVFVATVATAALFLVRGGPSRRRVAAGVALATLAASVLAVVVYYAHFLDTYRAELSRIGQETATAAADAGGRTIADRLKGVPYAITTYIGAPVLLFAFIGAVELARRRETDRLALALAGWTLSCVLFLAIGIVTPVDMRHYLAAVPVLAIAAGYGAAWAWSDGWPTHRPLWRLTAAVFLIGTISTGFHNWWNSVG